MTRLSDCRVFVKEFRRYFKTTGAILPSSRFLAAALARLLREGDRSSPRRILEVGPGTGAVTRRIAAALGPDDQLDLVELNSQFVANLRRSLEEDPLLRAVAPRTRIIHGAIQDMIPDTEYHAIVSGLPLSNFTVDEVRTVLKRLIALLRPGGTLSFFEYIGLRRLKQVVSFGEERSRLEGITQVQEDMLHGHRIGRDWVWANVPPAWVYHAQF